MPCPGDGRSRTVTLIPGDGICPLVTNAVQQVLEAMHVLIEFETFKVHGSRRHELHPSGGHGFDQDEQDLLEGSLGHPRLRSESDQYTTENRARFVRITGELLQFAWRRRGDEGGGAERKKLREGDWVWGWGGGGREGRLGLGLGRRREREELGEGRSRESVRRVGRRNEEGNEFDLGLVSGIWIGEKGGGRWKAGFFEEG